MQTTNNTPATETTDNPFHFVKIVSAVQNDLATLTFRREFQHIPATKAVPEFLTLAEEFRETPEYATLQNARQEVVNVENNIKAGREAAIKEEFGYKAAIEAGDFAQANEAVGMLVCGKADTELLGAIGTTARQILASAYQKAEIAYRRLVDERKREVLATCNDGELLEEITAFVAARLPALARMKNRRAVAVAGTGAPTVLDVLGAPPPVAPKPAAELQAAG